MTWKPPDNRVFVTAELAARWLEYASLGAIDWVKVRAFASEMKLGHFHGGRPNNEPVLFKRVSEHPDRLRPEDGRHRLLAIVTSGVSAWLPVDGERPDAS